LIDCDIKVGPYLYSKGALIRERVLNWFSCTDRRFFTAFSYYKIYGA